MKVHRDGRLRVLSINTHLGLALFAGVIGWLLDRFRVDIILIQEASRPRARARLKRELPRSRWIAVGPTGQDRAPLVGTFVYARRSRFTLVEQFDRVISKGQPQVDGLDRYPQRDLVAAVLRDRVTGRLVDASSVHTWQMVGRRLDGDGPIARGHRAQVQAVADHHHDVNTRYEGKVAQLAGGDWNHNLDLRGLAGPETKVAAPAVMRSTAKMVPTYRQVRSGRVVEPWRSTGEVRIDDVFYRPRRWFRLRRRMVISPPFKALDHPVTFVVFDLDAAEA